MASSFSVKHARVKTPTNQPIGVLLESVEHKDRYYQVFENRKIIPSKYLDWDYFVTCSSMTCIDCLNTLGLKRLVSSKGTWSLEVVKAFYTTLEYRVRDRTLIAEIRGKRIEMKEKKFVEILGIPPPSDDDICFTDNHNLLSTAFYDRAEVYKMITRDEVYTGQEIRVSKMDASDRLLLSVISNIIFNKSRNGSLCKAKITITLCCNHF